METYKIRYQSPLNCNIVYVLDFAFNRETKQATLQGNIIPKKLLDSLQDRGYNVTTKLI